MSRAYYCTVEELNERGRDNIPDQFRSNMHLIYSSPATLALTLREQKDSELREPDLLFQIRSC